MGGDTTVRETVREARPSTRAPIEQAQSHNPDAAAALAEVAGELGGAPLALVILFVPRRLDRATLEPALAGAFPGATVIGCTTAGEIGREGYLEDHLVAVGFASAEFTATIGLIPELDSLDAKAVMQLTLSMRTELLRAAPDRPPDHLNEFAFLLSDGLSLREDTLVWALGPALGRTPLVGGSAGDGLAYGETFVFAEGRFRRNIAVLALLRTRCRVHPFRFDHLLPTEQRMVVTGADPANRLVTEINAEPAAREYARMLGRDPDQLSPSTFASNPVVVCMGEQHHVRAIQRVEANGDLRFLSAIDEGLVLRLAESQPIAEHLERSLASLADPDPPFAILGCDCILRRLEAEATQAAGAVSTILARHRVVGFNTYGEQFNMLHVNQTFTGYAFYAPPED
jgi:hypothetical protein